MAEEFDSVAAIRREAAERIDPHRRSAPAADEAVRFLLEVETSYKRRTGRELSPETAATFLRQSTPLAKLG